MKLIPTLMDDLERFKILVERLTTDVVEIAREPEIEVDRAWDVISLIQYHNQTLRDEEHNDASHGWAKKMASWDGIYCWWRWRLLKQQQRNLACYINLAERAAAGYEKIDSNCKGNSVCKILSNSITCYREIVHERKSQLIWQTSWLSYCHTATSTFSTYYVE